MPRLARAIGQERNSYVRAAIWLYLLTGVRKSELLKAKWDDINFDRSELRMPETKSGKVHYLPLSKVALTILNGSLQVAGSPYILPGRHNRGLFLEISYLTEWFYV